MAQPLRVLIADDEPIARLDLREMLESLGHHVVAEAADGDTALQLARETQPEIAILDIRMPGLDGLEVARSLAEEHIAPTLILSAYTDQEYIERSKESGCLCYLVKPFRQSDLGPALSMTRALSDRLNAMQGELRSLQDALATRKAVERAKGLLMDRYALREQEAFRRIQQESMNSRRTMREVAEMVIAREAETPETPQPNGPEPARGDSSTDGADAAHADPAREGDPSASEAGHRRTAKARNRRPNHTPKETDRPPEEPGPDSDAA